MFLNRTDVNANYKLQNKIKRNMQKNLPDYLMNFHHLLIFVASV